MSCQDVNEEMYELRYLLPEIQEVFPLKLTNIVNNHVHVHRRIEMDGNYCRETGSTTGNLEELKWETLQAPGREEG